MFYPLVIIVIVSVKGKIHQKILFFLRRNLEKHLRICEFSMASLDHVRFARPLPCVFGIGRSRCANHGVSISQVLHFGHSIIKGVWMCGGKSILSLPDFLSWCDAAGFAIHVFFCLCMWSLSCTWQCVRKPKLPRMPQKIKPTENAPFLFQTTSFRYLISSKIVGFGDSARWRGRLASAASWTWVPSVPVWVIIKSCPADGSAKHQIQLSG